jgi:hypothetical protein
MPTPFDAGYGTEPFLTLVQHFPDHTEFPPNAFRVEWGPVFHRGRLDGTARLLAIGHDPAQHETIVRRVLVGRRGILSPGSCVFIQPFSATGARYGYRQTAVATSQFVSRAIAVLGAPRDSND